jgi:hypothetical protein
VNHRVTQLALACLLPLLGGCALTDVDQMFVAQPRAQVKMVRLIEQTNEGARVEVVVALKNTNDVPLPLVASDCSMSVAGRSPYRSATDPNAVLPAGSTQEIVIPLAFATPEPESAVTDAAYSVSGSVTYEPPGQTRKLLTDSGIPLPQVLFSGTGRIR